MTRIHHLAHKVHIRVSSKGGFVIIESAGLETLWSAWSKEREREREGGGGGEMGRGGRDDDG